MKAAVSEGFDTRLETFSIKIGGRWTTIRLEPELMDALQDIARASGTTLNQIATEVAVDCAEGSFTSALRVFILNHYRWAAGPARVAHRPAAAPRHRRRDDHIVRTPLPVGARDAAPELVSLYAWWTDKRSSGRRVPLHEDIDPRVVKRLGLAGLVHVVDVSAEDPLKYQYRLWGRRVRLRSARDFTGCRLSDLPGAEARDVTAEDYLTVAMTGAPRLQRIDAQVDEDRRIYQRLLVPFSGPDGKPSRLLIAVRYEASGLPGAPRGDLRG